MTNIQHTRLNPFSHNEESADDSDKSIEKRDSTIYYTQNGRKVYASNGITPDGSQLVIPYLDHRLIDLLGRLYQSYVASHEPPSSPIDFSLSDAALSAICKVLAGGRL